MARVKPNITAATSLNGRRSSCPQVVMVQDTSSFTMCTTKDHVAGCDANPENTRQRAGMACDNQVPSTTTQGYTQPKPLCTSTSTDYVRVAAYDTSRPLRIQFSHVYSVSETEPTTVAQRAANVPLALETQKCVRVGNVSRPKQDARRLNGLILRQRGLEELLRHGPRRWPLRHHKGNVRTRTVSRAAGPPHGRIAGLSFRNDGPPVRTVGITNWGSAAGIDITVATSTITVAVDVATSVVEVALAAQQLPTGTRVGGEGVHNARQHRREANNPHCHHQHLRKRHAVEDEQQRHLERRGVEYSTPLDTGGLCPPLS